MHQKKSILLCLQLQLQINIEKINKTDRMKVYKFGGASVRSAEGIRNIANIVKMVDTPLFIVVSAMGKTTNSMEVVLDNFMKADKDAAMQKLAEVEKYHNDIIVEIFENKHYPQQTLDLFAELKATINNGVGDDYDKWYDRLVSYGELISTSIVSDYLQKMGIDNQWVDMRHIIITDSNFREANVRMEQSLERIKELSTTTESKIFLGQGFIGANGKGDPTTLGREGSDYTAAVVGNLLDAESVSIWKDVPGILNADPRIFENTILIPELTYLDAVELAYSGAQIIHPKTIKPLENKKIPLYVRPFSTPELPGSVIKAETGKAIEIPVLILRCHQVLVTIRPRDFSFVLEDSLSKAFQIFQKNRLKVSMIQSSAISISVCVDNSRYLAAALDELGNDFKVTYNNDLELLTIRQANDAIIAETTVNKTILLSQRTRRSARFLMRAKTCQ